MPRKTLSPLWHALLGTLGLAIAVVVSYQLGARGLLSGFDPGHVHAPAANSAAGGNAGASKGEGGKKILYYRNPMGLPDTSPTPKKDPMGMDYLPVFEGGEEASGDSGIRVSSEKIQKLGVRIEKVERRNIDRTLRAAGRIEVDERRVFTVAPRFEGWIERLHVNATGQAVAKGASLFEVYSPELVSAQREYATAMAARTSVGAEGSEARQGIERLAESARQRLQNWQIGDVDLAALAAGGEAKRTMPYRSPVSGVVLEKKAVPGMRFMPGEVLYQIADLSTVWVIAEVNEQDIGGVSVGSRAKVHLDAQPGRELDGRVSYVYPTLRSETRSVQVRIELPNPGGMLKPAMFAQVELALGSPGSPGAAVGGKGSVGETAIAVPTSAVIDSGLRQVVLVSLGEGRFEPRAVKLGLRGNDYVEVREGLKEGESVVVAANFLLDAESNLKAALGGMSAAPELPNAKVSAGGTAGAVGASAGHRGEGTFDAIDAASGGVTITHAPIKSLGWPKMTMDFVLANQSLIAAMKPGTAIAFEFVERGPGEWVVTKIESRADKGKATVAPPTTTRPGVEHKH